jgi:hypothetical protein
MQTEVSRFRVPLVCNVINDMQIKKKNLKRKKDTRSESKFVLVPDIKVCGAVKVE